MEVEKGNATTTTPKPPVGVTFAKDYVSYGTVALMVIALIAFLINAEYKRAQTERKMAAAEAEKDEMKTRMEQLTLHLEEVTRKWTEEENRVARRHTEDEEAAQVRR